MKKVILIIGGVVVVAGALLAILAHSLSEALTLERNRKQTEAARDARLRKAKERQQELEREQEQLLNTIENEAKNNEGTGGDHGSDNTTGPANELDARS